MEGAGFQRGDAPPDGPPEEEYTSAGSAALKWLLPSLGGLALAAAVLGGVIREPSERLWLSAAMLAPLCLLIAGYGLFNLVFRQRIAVHPGGVFVRGVVSAAFVPWDDITAVFEFSPPLVPDAYRCGFRTSAGRTFRFSAERVGRLRELGHRLRSRVEPRVLADARAALGRGEVVWFGPVGLGRQGFHSAKGLLGWGDASYVGLSDNGSFEILEAGRSWSWFSKRPDVVENVGALLTLYNTRREWAQLTA